MDNRTFEIELTRGWTLVARLDPEVRGACLVRRRDAPDGVGRWLALEALELVVALAGTRRALERQRLRDGIENPAAAWEAINEATAWVTRALEHWLSRLLEGGDARNRALDTLGQEPRSPWARRAAIALTEVAFRHRFGNPRLAHQLALAAHLDARTWQYADAADILRAGVGLLLRALDEPDIRVDVVPEQATEYLWLPRIRFWPLCWEDLERAAVPALPAALLPTRDALASLRDLGPVASADGWFMAGEPEHRVSWHPEACMAFIDVAGHDVVRAPLRADAVHFAVAALEQASLLDAAGMTSWSAALRAQQLTALAHHHPADVESALRTLITGRATWLAPTSLATLSGSRLVVIPPADEYRPIGRAISDALQRSGRPTWHIDAGRGEDGALSRALGRAATVVLQLSPGGGEELLAALDVAERAGVVATIVGGIGTDLPPELALRVRRVTPRTAPDGWVALALDAG